jgi:hypothetical protein
MSGDTTDQNRGLSAKLVDATRSPTRGATAKHQAIHLRGPFRIRSRRECRVHDWLCWRNGGSLLYGTSIGKAHRVLLMKRRSVGGHAFVKLKLGNVIAWMVTTLPVAGL